MLQAGTFTACYPTGCLYIQTLKYVFRFTCILYGEIGKVYVLFVAEGLIFLVFRIKFRVLAFFICKFTLQMDRVKRI